MTDILVKFDQEAIDILDEIQNNTYATSHSDVLKNALGVYHSLYSMLKEKPKRKLAIIDREANELQELSIPSFLPDVRH